MDCLTLTIRALDCKLEDELRDAEQKMISLS